MELEFGQHARYRMEQYGIEEEWVYATVREFDEVRIGIGEARSTNYVKHGIVQGRLSLRVAVDPYKQPQKVDTVHLFDPQRQKGPRSVGGDEGMKIKVDWEADVLYIRFDEEAELKVAEEVGEEVVLDLDEQERIVGLEVLNLSSKCGETKGLSNLEIREQSTARTG